MNKHTKCSTCGATQTECLQQRHGPDGTGFYCCADCDVETRGTHLAVGGFALRYKQDVVSAYQTAYLIWPES